MQGSGEFGAGGWDRDNRCGECGIAMGQVHRAGCRTGMKQAETAVRESVQRYPYRESAYPPDLLLELGAQRLREFHPDLAAEINKVVERKTGCTCKALLRQPHAPGCAINQRAAEPGWREVGVFNPAFDSAKLIGRVAFPHTPGHGPESHGPEFWSSGCTDPHCAAYRENEQRKAWLEQQPEYVALKKERDEIMVRLNELAAEWDWDFWYGDHYNYEDARTWAKKAIARICLIIGVEVPKRGD